jgi:hypothetical protein
LTKNIQNFILSALPKLRKGFESFLYQRVAISKANENYQYLELVALFTALYLQADADKQTQGQRYKYQDMKVQHTSNPYADLLEQPDIKCFSKSGPSKCLLALSKTLCDPVILSNSKSMGSRHIKLTGEKNLDKLVSEVPSKMGH